MKKTSGFCGLRCVFPLSTLKDPSVFVTLAHFLCGYQDHSICGTDMIIDGTRYI